MSLYNNFKIKCEIFTRCVGYFRPVSQFNKGKKQEFKDRKYLNFPGVKSGNTTSKTIKKKDA